MDNKLKDFFKKTISNLVKTTYNGEYIGNMEDINTHLIKFAKGGKEPIVLQALVEYYFESVRPSQNQSYLKAGGDELFLHNLIYLGGSKGFNPQSILTYVLNDTFDVNDIALGTLFELFLLTKDERLLNKIINSNNSYPLIILWLIRGTKKQKTLLKNSAYLDVLKDLINRLDSYDFSGLITKIDGGGGGMSKLPEPILNIFKEKISTQYNFSQQAILWNTTGRIFFLMYDKLRDKDFQPVGSNPKFIMIKNMKSGKLGYADENGKIIIPTIFDELSAVNKVKYDGIVSVTGHLHSDEGDMKAGYYKISKEGKVLSYSKD